jgi:predicted GIY-YIG superfamily endonuclease
LLARRQFSAQQVVAPCQYAVLVEDPQYLYRFRDNRDVLIYIGISDDWSRRVREHWHTKPWAADIRSIMLETHTSRTAALAAESAAIRTEHPLYNVMHNGATYQAAQPRRHQWSAGEVVAVTALMIFAGWVLWQVGSAAYEKYQDWQSDRAEFRAWKAQQNAKVDTADKSEREPFALPGEEQPITTSSPVPGAEPVAASTLPGSPPGWLALAVIALAYMSRTSADPMSVLLVEPETLVPPNGRCGAVGGDSPGRETL